MIKALAVAGILAARPLAVAAVAALAASPAAVAGSISPSTTAIGVRPVMEALD